MGAVPGIAGSRTPEQAGCFFCLDEFEVEWFVNTINNTGDSVDVWVVEGVAENELVEAMGGYFYLPRTVEPEYLTLWRSDCPPPRSPDEAGPGTMRLYESRDPSHR
jgi:hypothetical protein